MSKRCNSFTITTAGSRFDFSTAASRIIMAFPEQCWESPVTSTNQTECVCCSSQSTHRKSNQHSNQHSSFTLKPPPSAYHRHACMHVQMNTEVGWAIAAAVACCARHAAGLSRFGFHFDCRAVTCAGLCLHPAAALSTPLPVAVYLIGQAM